MKISVALCTYNGERFLAEQLASIARQDRAPDEIVISDDGSTDETLRIAREFAQSAEIPVQIHRQSENVGSTKNFEAAVRRAKGDVIVLADQDDVWREDKVARLEDALRSRPDAAFAFSNAEVVGDDLSPLGHDLWEAVHFGGAEQRQFENGRAPDVLLRYNVVTGATLAFRSEYRNALLPIPRGWVHDGWIALVLSLLAPCVPISAPLIRYRQHAAQQLGGRRSTLCEKIEIARSQGSEHFRRLARDYAAALRRARKLSGRLRDPGWIGALEAKVRHLIARAEIRREWRLPLILSEAMRLRYGRYSLGWKSVAQDLVLRPRARDRSRGKESPPSPPDERTDDRAVVEREDRIPDPAKKRVGDPRVCELESTGSHR